MSAAFVIASLLFLTLVVAFPIWDVIETRRLRSTSDSTARVTYYWRIMGVEWSLTLLVIALLGWRATLFFKTPVRPLWLPPHDTLIGLLLAFVAGLFIPSILAWRSARAGSFFAKQLAAIDYLLPKTQSQRVLFLLVSVTAGICEEVIFRAFAIHYLAAVLPGVSIWLCVILAALLFGVIHVGQGVSGVISTGILGAVFGVLYVGFGALWIPILLHIVVDARFAILPLPNEQTPAT